MEGTVMHGNAQKAENFENLSRRQAQAVSALLSEPTIQKAADLVGVNESTVRRWLQEPDFVKAYREGCKAIVNSSIGKLQTACAEAVETLRAVMEDGDAPAGSRVSAARTTLETALKAVELQDLEERICRLESWTEFKR